MTITRNTPWVWVAFPILSLLFVMVSPALSFGGSLTSASALFSTAVMIVVMLGTVFAAVYHAEVIAHRVGEPFGTLILTMAVTVIEVALIASLMVMPNASAALARDTVFAVVMIVCNGIVGICVLLGGIRYREQEFKTSGTGAYLSVLGTLAVLGLVLPNYTLATPGPLLFDGPARVRQRHDARALRRVFVHADGDAHRLFPGETHGKRGRKHSFRAPGRSRSRRCCCWFRCSASCWSRRNSPSCWRRC